MYLVFAMKNWKIVDCINQESLTQINIMKHIETQHKIKQIPFYIIVLRLQKDLLNKTLFIVVKKKNMSTYNGKRQ